MPVTGSERGQRSPHRQITPPRWDDMGCRHWDPRHWPGHRWVGGTAFVPALSPGRCVWTADTGALGGYDFLSCPAWIFRGSWEQPGSPMGLLLAAVPEGRVPWSCFPALQALATVERTMGIPLWAGSLQHPQPLRSPALRSTGGCHRLCKNGANLHG